MIEVPKGLTGIVIAAPVPYEFFRGKGTGESAYQDHAGAWHMAMNQAGVHKGNLIPYSSMLPEIASEISQEEGYKRITHGAQVGIIQAKSEVDLEEGVKRATAAILFGWLRPKLQNERREHAGGLVCEYREHGDEKEARENLMGCINAIFRKPSGIDGKIWSDDYRLDIQPMEFISFIPKQRYGVAISLLAFVSYFINVLAQNVFQKDDEASAFAQTAFGRGI